MFSPQHRLENSIRHLAVFGLHEEAAQHPADLAATAAEGLPNPLQYLLGSDSPQLAAFHAFLVDTPLLAAGVVH